MRARAQEPASVVGQQHLVLEVRLNGQRSELLWQFDRLADGGLATSAERLRQLGFDLVRLHVLTGAPQVRLDRLPGITYRYSEAAQAVDIDARDEALVPVVLDSAALPHPLDIDRVEAHGGALLSYGLFVAGSSEAIRASGQYDLRLLSKVGVFSTSGYATYSSVGPEKFDHVRLDTNWRYVDARQAFALEAGDVISDGGDLGIVYRLGGLQFRRDYRERPDIVTAALRILSATAAVPSMIDLYVNGLLHYNGQVGRGPFEFRALPNLGNGATATVVLTDAVGRETRIEKPIFFAPDLLAPGTLTFSAEAGFPRLNYGVKSFSYLPEPVASGTAAYGFTDWLTAGAHAEAMRDFVNGSAGISIRLGGFGAVRVRGAASHFRKATNTRLLIDASARIAGINLYGGIERTHKGFQDLVTVTAIKAGYGPVDTLPRPLPLGANEPVLTAFSRRTEKASASFTLFDTGVGLNYTRMRLPRQDLKLASGSLSRTLFDRVSIWANAYKDFGDREDHGVFLGFSLTLGKRIAAASNFSRSSSGSILTTRASRQPDGTPGSWGWSVTDSETLSGRNNSYRGATVRYLGRSATLEGGIEQQGGLVRATAYAEGSVVAMGGGVFLSPRIDNSFAIVRGAGANTPVLANTRNVARTDKSGRALVPYLPSYQESQIGIDPVNLPVDLRPQRTEALVVPADHAGVIVDFGVAPIAAAIVTLVDAAGQPLTVGDVVTIEGGEQAVLGYDGRVYLTGLRPSNTVRVVRQEGQPCTARFAFQPLPGKQVQIGPVPCR